MNIPNKTVLITGDANRSRAAILPLLFMIVFPIDGFATILEPQTVAAWDDYLRVVDASPQSRVSPAGRFLWSLETQSALLKSGVEKSSSLPQASRLQRKCPAD